MPNFYRIRRNVGPHRARRAFASTAPVALPDFLLSALRFRLAEPATRAASQHFHLRSILPHTGVPDSFLHTSQNIHFLIVSQISDKSKYSHTP